MAERIERCSYSIGSSIVMMWQVRVRLISPTSAARVEDFPEPVGPQTRTSPRLGLTSSASIGGRLRPARVGMSEGSARKRHRRLAALAVDIDPESPGRADPVVEGAATGDAQAEVGRAALVEVLALLGAEVGMEHPVDLVPFERPALLHPQQPAVDPEDRRQARDQQQVARLLLDDLGQETVERLPFRHLGLGERAERERARGFGAFGFEKKGRLAGGALLVQ